MGKFLKQVFTWWHDQTLGTRLWTWRRGRLVGTDQDGNCYYEDKGGSHTRWVVYNGLVEASRVPQKWHAWLHHTHNEVGSRSHRWERAHLPNLTGTHQAHKPGRATRRRVGATYESWEPPRGALTETKRGYDVEKQ